MRSNTYNPIQLPNARVGIVRARFNEEITGGLLDGALRVLHEAGIPDEQIHVVTVPGSLEIPVACAMALESISVDALITLGCIVKGDTLHDEYIASSVYGALQNLSVAKRVPIAAGVLTVLSLDQARTRSGGTGMNRGAEAAKAALEMIVVSREMKK